MSDKTKSTLFVVLTLLWAVQCPSASGRGDNEGLTL